MADVDLSMFTRTQLREAQADAIKKLAFVKETIKNIPEAHIPFPRLQEISFLEQRIREYQAELARQRKPEMPVHVFYSYSRSDEALLVELDEHLSELKRDGPLEIFWDRDLQPGIEWHSEIKDELKEADVVLLLVSPEFLASRYCRQVELPATLDLHDCGLTSAIPIILRPCSWHETSLGRLQALPRGGKPVIQWTDRTEAWADTASKISTVIQRIRQGNSTAVKFD
jgi:TIR domain-containing protein